MLCANIQPATTTSLLAFLRLHPIGPPLSVSARNGDFDL